MTEREIRLPWGSEQLAATLPEGWHLAGVMAPSALPAVADPQAEAARSLQAPIGLPPLSQLARPGMKVALVIDDDSRPTPVRLLLAPVLAELERAGVALEQVTVIPALGVHRAMAEDELARRIGPAWLPRLRWTSHDCDDAGKLADLGTTSRGTPVSINKTAAEADLIVSIGCIEPHIIASFGGGYKNLFPGIAGRATIAHNHSLNCRPESFNNVGRPIEGNPMRLDLEEAGKMVTPPVFIVNAVLNSRLELVRVVCGHPIDAHREGARTSAAIYGVPVPGLADVVIACSHPMDQDLRQGVKALANTIRAVRPGGVMITLIRADEGVGVFGLANRKLPVGRRGLRLLAPLLLKVLPGLKLKGMGEEDRFFLYFALQAMRRADLLLYAPTIPAEIQPRLPFASFVGSVDEALARAQEKLGPRAEVLVFPHGGSTYPILPQKG
ncbi:MAG TPA: nickel-dependent lactate racemase [Anaerolineae bacterium]|nr:nickel-dependent lactate racemase [Anaerolineae bacterium]HOQ99954.1 nickel-dependent lactate racemase [Anaerolineae bacterium]HPL27884.1 nickel-dependent lactate racemase [Anaerolineae bacterium]